MVAMLGLMRMVSIFDSLKALMAWDPAKVSTVV